MNLVILQGHLTKDIQVFENSTGVKSAKGIIAVDREKIGKKECDFLSFTLLGNLVDYVAKYGKKGVLATIRGHWNHNLYKDKDGKTQTRDTCFVDEIKLHSSKPQENLSNEEEDNLDIDDEMLPF